MVLESTNGEAVQGSAYTIRITVKAPDSSDVLQIVDISAATEVVFGLFVTANIDNEAVVSKSMGNSQISLPDGGSDGVLDVTIVAADTLDLDPGDYEWQVKVTLSGDTPKINVAGTLTIYPSGDFG